MTHGLVSFLADSESGVVVTPAWVAYIRALGYTNVLASVQASRHNTLRYDLLRRGALTYRDGGVKLTVRLPVEADAPWTEESASRRVYPNEPLGYAGNKRQNRFIKEFAVRAGRIAHELVPCGVDTFIVGNEQNLLGSIEPGENVPPVGGEHAPATAPEIAASLWYEATGYLHAGGVAHVWAGALSFLPMGTVADIGWHDNTFGSRYIRRGLAYLKSTGVKTLPFAGLATNSEGAWAAPKTAAMRSAISGAIIAAGYADLPLLVSEWGWPAGQHVDPAKATETAAALGAIADTLFFDQGPLQERGYGVHGWQVGGGGFLPTTQQTPWYDVLHTMLSAA